MSDLKLMTHVVAGYPSMETTEELIILMANNGADMIEIQIPFSDPLADGSTIMKANQCALDNGVTVSDCFDLVKKLKDKINVPLLFMTYANIPFRYGMEKFIADSAEIGVYGLIIPDLTYDEQNSNYISLCKKYGLHAIQVVSPDMNEERLESILSISSGFVYTTLKVGITGVGKSIDKSALQHISRIKNLTSLPVAAGFGISSPEMFKEISNIADFGVVGSYIIDLLEKSDEYSVVDFINDCKVF